MSKHTREELDKIAAETQAAWFRRPALAGSTAPKARAKRYLVFASHDYYPGGGWADFVGTTDDYEEAHRLGREAGRDEHHVVDLHDLDRDCDERDGAR